MACPTDSLCGLSSSSRDIGSSETPCVEELKGQYKRRSVAAMITSFQYPGQRRASLTPSLSSPGSRHKKTDHTLQQTIRPCQQYIPLVTTPHTTPYHVVLRYENPEPAVRKSSPPYCPAHPSETKTGTRAAAWSRATYETGVSINQKEREHNKKEEEERGGRKEGRSFEKQICRVPPLHFFFLSGKRPLWHVWVVCVRVRRPCRPFCASPGTSVYTYTLG